MGGMRADGSRKLSAASDAGKEDEAVALVVPRDITPNQAGSWDKRRLVNEHAQLEDCGAESGVSAIGGATGYTPIVAEKEGVAGFLASKVVIGRVEK